MAQTLSLPGRHLAHIRQLDLANPGWGQQQVWSLPGATPSEGFFNVTEGSDGTNMHHSIGGNVETIRRENPASQPTTTRDARYDVFSSLPAARFFQGYFSTGFSWLAPELNVVGNLTHMPLHANWNPAQQGTKELYPATVFNPYPPGGALWPKAV